MFKDVVSPTKLVTERRYEVQRTNNFEFFVANLPSGGDASRDLTTAVETFALPTISTEPTELHLGNSSVKVASTKAVFGEGSLVLKDFIIADTEAIILAWQKLVYDVENDHFGFAADYKRQAKVIEYSPNGEYSRVWVLDGCWPSSADFGELNNEAGDKKQVTVTIQYDKAYRVMDNTSLTVPTIAI